MTKFFHLKITLKFLFIFQVWNLFSVLRMLLEKTLKVGFFKLYKKSGWFFGQCTERQFMKERVYFVWRLEQILIILRIYFCIILAGFDENSDKSLRILPCFLNLFNLIECLVWILTLRRFSFQSSICFKWVEFRIQNIIISLIKMRLCWCIKIKIEIRN